MSHLPFQWSLAPIGQLCSLENGRAFKPVEWTTKGLPIVRIQNLNNPYAKYNYFDGEFADRYHLRGGELLFAWSGTPGTSFGAHVWRGGEAVLNQHIFRVDFDGSGLDKRYFRYAINQKLTELIDVAHGGVGLRHVTKGTFEETEIAIAPFNEQKRIADKLAAVLARVDACLDRLDRIPAILKRFRQSVLADATSGKLTEDWRADTGSLCEWQDVCLSEVIVDMRNGLALKPTETPPGSKILRISAVRAGQLDFADHRYLVVTDKEAELYALKVHDLLFTRYNGTLEFVGVCASLKHDAQGYVYPDKLIRVRADESMAYSKFIEIVFGSEPVRRQIENFVKSSAGQKGISGADLKSTRFMLPSLPEQTEIVRRVDALFAYADRLEARYAAARAHVEMLTPATLAKAFRGELVPQDPNDEPASALLERIRARRADQISTQSNRGRKMAATRAF